MAVLHSMANSILALYIIIIPVLGIHAQWTTNDETCNTLSRGLGNCIPVRQCDTIMNFLQSVVNTNTDLTNDEIEHLRGYQCDFQASTVKVCCPKESLFVKPLITRFFPNEDPPAPDISNHRNLHLLPRECGVSQANDRISGGNSTYFSEFPWMVLLSYSTGKGSSYKCGGTIINNRYILTAAHCITNLSNMKLSRVRVGEHNITSLLDCDIFLNGVTHCAPPVQDIFIEEIIPHPNFSASEYVNDVGLLRLAAPINTSLENAKPICLPITASLRNLNFTDEKLTVTGWGITELGRTSDTLLKVDIPILTRSECQKSYLRSTAKISHSHLCGGGKDRHDSCGGDSGGPLQRIENLRADARYIQYGIVSFGARTCGRVGVPGVYTRVDYYMDWILDNIRP